MNKIVFYFIVIIIFAGCIDSEDIWNEEENVSYIDYSTLSADKLSLADKLLLENMDFQKGKYVCKLSKNDAIAKGISEKRYQYFLEYLENENAIIAEYIKDGATVTFGNKSFGPEGEFVEESLFEFEESRNLLSRNSSGFTAYRKDIYSG